jgi:hypothetical protein
VTIKRQFSKLPRCLIIHLKRYKYKFSDNTCRLVKNDSPIEIPSFLTMSYLTAPIETLQAPKKLPEKFEIQLTPYKDNHIRQSPFNSPIIKKQQKLNLDFSSPIKFGNHNDNLQLRSSPRLQSKRIPLAPLNNNNNNANKDLKSEISKQLKSIEISQFNDLDPIVIDDDDNKHNKVDDDDDLLPDLDLNYKSKTTTLLEGIQLDGNFDLDQPIDTDLKEEEEQQVTKEEEAEKEEKGEEIYDFLNERKRKDTNLRVYSNRKHQKMKMDNSQQNEPQLDESSQQNTIQFIKRDEKYQKLIETNAQVNKQANNF